MPKTYQRNKDVTEGSNIVDPPVIKSYERDIMDAAAAADLDAIAFHTARYNDAREELVAHIEKTAQDDEGRDEDKDVLRGDALHARAAELDIEGRGSMSANELRDAIAREEGSA